MEMKLGKTERNIFPSAEWFPRQMRKIVSGYYCLNFTKNLEKSEKYKSIPSRTMYLHTTTSPISLPLNLS